MWTPELERDLTDRWNRGETASQIAAGLPPIPPKGKRPERKVTRDMVIGKARRMGLPSRPSPIRREA